MNHSSNMSDYRLLYPRCLVQSSVKLCRHRRKRMTVDAQDLSESCTHSGALTRGLRKQKHDQSDDDRPALKRNSTYFRWLKQLMNKTCKFVELTYHEQQVVRSLKQLAKTIPEHRKIYYRLPDIKIVMQYGLFNKLPTVLLSMIEDFFIISHKRCKAYWSREVLGEFQKVIDSSHNCTCCCECYCCTFKLRRSCNWQVWRGPGFISECVFFRD